jgi:hypothetical protein
MTYENAYAILEKVRRGLKEYSTAYMQATDTTGAFANDDIMNKINDAQKYLFDILIARDPQLFYKKTTLTPASSVLTMPSDFYRIRRLENSDGLKCTEKPLQDKDGTTFSVYTGSPNFYYWQGGQIYIDQESFTEVMTLYYVYRPVELTQGMTSAGGALSATLATTSKALADYYNNVIIENITDATVDLISDYSAARVATVTNTWAASKYYGTVSQLPEAFHPFISRKALILMKQAPQSRELPSPIELASFDDDLNQTLNSLLGTFNTNQDIAELFQ